MTWFRPRVPLALAVSLIAALGLPSAARADESGDRAPWAGLKYVAIGDGFATGPKIPGQTISCGRTEQSYPNMVNQIYKPDGFFDVSCNTASTTTKELYNTQLYALKPDTDIVTLSVGFNDLVFNGLFRSCAGRTPVPGAQPLCTTEWLPSGQKDMDAALATAEREVGLLLDEIHKLSPKANIFLVGYPALVPDDGSDCSRFGLSSADVAVMSRWLLSLNDALYRAADTHSEAYVDTYSATHGHDLCQADGARWVEGIDVSDPNAPVYLTADGTAAVTKKVLAAFA